MNSNSNDKIMQEIHTHSHNEIGMLTTIWGPNLWKSLHCISFVYPDNPTESEKQHYKTYFQTLKYVLPCCICRKHFTEHTQLGAKFEITDKIFNNKTTLTKWLFELHNCVNESLGMKYDITYEDVCNKYNSYIADCNMSIEKKTIAYINSYDQESPLVAYKIAACFIEYAKSRGMTDYESNLKKTHEIFKTKRNSQKMISDEWIKRNSDCFEIVKYMRTNGIIGFEKLEKDNVNYDSYNNLPTIEELKLLQLMSTTLNIRTLKHMTEKLGFSDVSETI